MELLKGLKVVELCEQITGPYCGRILTDLGATVLKVEPPGGDDLRKWGPFPSDAEDVETAGLFLHLNANKHGVVMDLREEVDRQRFVRLVDEADILVESLGSGELESLGLTLETLGAANPDLVIVRISNFGQHGPLSTAAMTELTLQAAAGWITLKDPDSPPVQAGGRIAEYVGGAYGALAALTGLELRGTGVPVEIDLSIQESLLGTLPYPMLVQERMAKMGISMNRSAAPMLGIVHCSDGLIGINCLTGQHWLDSCQLLGVPEFTDRQMEMMSGDVALRSQFYAAIQPWLDSHTVDEVLDLTQIMRIPSAPVGDGQTMPKFPQYDERSFFRNSSEPEFLKPGPSFRLAENPSADPSFAPRLSNPEERFPDSPHSWPSATVPLDVTLPFTGLKVFDLSTFWAGAYVSCFLGAFGADVIKVESIQHPDGHRYSGAFPFEGDDWYERSVLWQGTNLNKRDITLDLSREEGLTIAKRLIADSDVVIENFSPRVVENFGLDYESITQFAPNIIQLRMPGFGLEGPWRDFVGWAMGIEQVAGWCTITGYPDGEPKNLAGPADPIIGVHAAAVLLSALAYRERTGAGQLIEIPQIEVAANLTAESVISYSMNGTLSPRTGNRRRDMVQGVYPCVQPDSWVAISIVTDAQWQEFVKVLEEPTALTSDEFHSQPQRLAAHDAIDLAVAQWSRNHEADEIVNLLQAVGVPASRVLTGDRMFSDPQLQARQFYQPLTHAVSGELRYPGWPFRFTPGPTRHHLTPPPLLGQDNKTILSDRLGLSEDDLTKLREGRIIGDAPLHA